MIHNQPFEDAFGQALLDELDTGDVFEITERDDGYISARPIHRYFAQYPDWSDLESSAINQCRGRVLDLGAGAGRAAIELQHRGLPVLAVDPSPGAVQVCHRRGVHNIVAGTIDQLAPTANPFDSVVMLGGNLGLLANPTRAVEFLNDLARVTAPDAQVFGIGTDPYPTHDRDHLAYYQRNRTLGRLGGQLRLRVRHHAMSTPWFELWMASEEELKSVLTQTVWELTDIRSDGAVYLATLTKRHSD